MADDIVLEYKRVDVDRCHGRIFQGSKTFVSFHSEDFRSMLREFAQALQSDQEARAVWQRTDRPGLTPYYLDAEVTQLFREDPVAAIEGMCPPAISPSTTIRRVQQERVQMVPISVRAGHDALADAFGEQIYIRARERKENIYIECPCCGIWANVIDNKPQTQKLSVCINMKCTAGTLFCLVKLVNEKWATMNAEDILETKSPRFYLPRAWNEGRSWISFGDLQQKWEEYKKEKESYQ